LAAQGQALVALQKAARPSLKDLLLAPGARFENLIPERHKLRRRTVLEIK
jgi:hypothetical protein